MPSLTRTLLTAAFAVTCTFSAFGQTTEDIQYGDFTGSTVDYFDVSEDFQGLFGAPVVSGDSLVFSPLEFVAFAAQAEDGNIAFTDGSLSFTVASQSPDQPISSLTLEESGAFAFGGTGTEATSVSVAAAFSINILEVDGVAFDGASQIVSSNEILSANIVDSPGIGQVYSTSVNIDIAGLAAALNPSITGNITRASVVLDNQLLAVSEDGSIAFVDKKSVDVVTITVPEPASVALLGFGSLCVLARRRRTA